MQERSPFQAISTKVLVQRLFYLFFLSLCQPLVSAFFLFFARALQDYFGGLVQVAQHNGKQDSTLTDSKTAILGLNDITASRRDETRHDMT